jgi:cytoskeletal protein RodZ
MAMAPPVSESSGGGRRSQVRTRDNGGAGLGELLRCARERRGLTLEQISKETRIHRRHLEALERDDLAVVPGGFYRRAQIRAFAQAVHLDPALALDRLDHAAEPRRGGSVVLRETPVDRQTTGSSKRLLVVIGVAVAVAVLGRMISEWEWPADAARPRPVQVPSQHPASGVREVLPEPTNQTSQHSILDQEGPPAARTTSTRPAAIETSRDGATGRSDIGRTTTVPAEAGSSREAVTELVVRTQPAGARVTVDGIGWGVAPITIRYLPAGDKRIRVSKDGYATEERVVHVIEGQLKTLDIELRGAR